MYLTGNEQKVANNKRTIILNNFTNHRLCNDCKGTGLGNITNSSQGFTWDGVSFCDECNGIGFLDWEETLFIKLCPDCKGGGGLNKVCTTCNGKGVLDWIQYIRVGGKKNKEKKYGK